MRNVSVWTLRVSSPVRVRMRVPRHADVVAEVEEFVEVEGGLADVVFADVDLEALAALKEGGEAGFALEADGDDAAGDGGGEVFGFESFGGFGGAVGVEAEGEELGDGVGVGEGVGVGLLAEGDDLLEGVEARVVEVFFELGLKLRQGCSLYLWWMLTTQYSEVVVGESQRVSLGGTVGS